MRKSVIVLVAVLAACKPSPEEQARRDAAAVAMVEKAQRVKAPVVPIALQPLDQADYEAARLDGAGCSFRTADDARPLLAADKRRAVIRFDPEPTVLVVDIGTSPPKHYYVGNTHTVRIIQGSTAGKRWGEEGLRYPADITVEDADHRPVFQANGFLYCGADSNQQLN